MDVHVQISRLKCIIIIFNVNGEKCARAKRFINKTLLEGTYTIHITYQNKHHIINIVRTSCREN